MVVRWGMSPKVGPLNFTDNETAGMFAQRPYDEATASLIDDEIRRIAEECQVEAERLLGEHRQQLDSLTRALLTNDSLDEGEILQAAGMPPAATPPKSAIGTVAAASSARSR